MQGMSVAEITYQPSFSAELLSAAHFPPLVAQPQDSLLAIDVPAFGAHMQGEIADVRIGNEYREVTFESFVDAGVSALLALRNEQSNGVNSDLEIKGASLSFAVGDHRPRAHFIANTMYAMLGLAGPITVSIPASKIELGLNFEVPPSKVGDLLQLRQTYFGLMVIEKATGVEFDIPLHISGEEMNSISFAYHAILMHQFVWRVNDITYQMPATEEMLAWFDDLKSNEPNAYVYKLESGPDPITRTVLGQEISLGDQTIFIDDGVIENREVVRRELAKNDGQIVPIRIIPRSRKGRYVFASTPRLPEIPWDKNVENFIQLEDALNERLAARYHKLAASTLADLTPEEIELVTTPPKLDDDAFQM
jgi:hypothetical protein